MMNLTRRKALLAGAALPMAGGLTLANSAQADGHTGPAGKSRTFALGDMEVSVLLAGNAVRDGDMQGTFGMNVDAETFQNVSREAFLPTDKAVFFFQPTVVKTGDEVVLFDTGLNAGGITTALESAGLAPSDITTVVITHMHGDHIGGLMNEGALTFGDVRYVTGEAEMNAWKDSGNERFEQVIAPMADRFELIGEGAEVAPGLTSVAMAGHTPGHMGYRISSGDAQAMLTADLANHYIWSLAHPDWEVRFDMDKEAAAASRRRVLDMVATDRIPMIGYHMPFPAIGYVETNGDGFRWVPESYQMML